MRASRCWFAWALASVAVGCVGSEESSLGSIHVELVGQSPSGAVFRLRDATITVAGPTPRVWNTEDDPDQTSLSANVLTGSYSATLADGWRFERLDHGETAPVTAELLSPNPALFAVADRQRTSVQLQFLVGRELVDLSQGYDIGITIADPPPPVIVVTNQNPPTVQVYPADATGDVAPIRTISGAATTLVTPWGVTISREQIIVCDVGGAIDVFPLTANGNVAPIRRIAGPATTLVDPSAAVVYNGELYVAQSHSLAVFPIDATGNVPPTRTITGIPIGLGHLAIDSGELYVTTPSDSIRVYPATASGPASPTRVIEPRSDGFCPSEGLTIAGNSIFASDRCAHGVVVFPKSAIGPVLPQRVIAGDRTGLRSPQELRLSGDELYVSERDLNRVQVFRTSASGDAAPLRSIVGPHTNLTGPIGLAVF